MGLELSVYGEQETGAIINDLHVPFHDPATLKVVNKFLEEIQPSFLIYNGDLNDWYQISSFVKNPSRSNMLQGDIEELDAIFQYHKTILPNTRRIVQGGNHEDRLERYMWTRAQEISNLKCLTMEQLYGAEVNEFEYVPFQEGVLINNVLLIVHGDLISKHSGMTARSHYEKHGGCGICGHSHRGGSYYKRDRFGVWGWWENFCLCDLDPDWIKHPNWQQGFSLVHFTSKDMFWVEQVPIIGHKFIYGGKRYD